MLATTKLLIDLGDAGRWQHAAAMLGMSETEARLRYRVVKTILFYRDDPAPSKPAPKPKLDVEIDRHGLRPEVPANWSRPSPVREACKTAGIAPDELMSKTRKHRIAHARQHVMYILHMRGWSNPKIGDALGGLDHTTVMHGWKAHAARIAKTEQGRACA